MSENRSKSKSKQPPPATPAKKPETGELDKGKLDQVTGGVSLSYAKIEPTYKPQKPDGSL